ncbi:MAG: leucine-rich repeat domain-containing protein [Planctomycetota bacterium]
MRHHFGDFLDREGGYWSMTPNRERYGQDLRDIAPGTKGVTVATIGRDSDDWQRVFTLPDLVELTLHEPAEAQLARLGELPALRRLRITHARPKNLQPLAALAKVEELVLEYVSGFDDLSPLRGMTALRALHVENLRRVRDFGGLAGCAALRFLAIYGTSDWKQPIADFEFARGLPGLEVLNMWQVKCAAPFPATLPLTRLPRLRQLGVHRSYLPAEECALLEQGLPGVEGAAYGPWERRIFASGTHPSGQEACFEFTGTGSGRVRVDAKTAAARCAEFEARYETLRAQARQLLDGQNGT